MLQIYATKNLTLDGRQVKRGDVLATIDTTHPVERVLAGLQNGAASFNKPEPVKPAAEPSKK